MYYIEEIKSQHIAAFKKSSNFNLVKSFIILVCKCYEIASAFF